MQYVCYFCGNLRIWEWKSEFFIIPEEFCCNTGEKTSLKPILKPALLSLNPSKTECLLVGLYENKIKYWNIIEKIKTRKMIFFVQEPINTATNFV